MSSKALIIVESPAKARTISKYLGRDYIVESSIGHIRDLPSKADEIPAAHKKKPWARTGVDVENGFKPLYVIPKTKKQQVKKLKDLLDGADALYLATDEDREGEAIAWHLYEVLQPTVPVKRMVFHEITEDAIQHAIDNPRDLDDRLVNAQEARRILDRLYGYEVSPVLWKKVRPRLSAGRVQSVATRLIVERERMRIAFRSGDYWSLAADMTGSSTDGLGDQPGRFNTGLLELAGRRIAVGKDFDPNTGKLSEQAHASNVLLLEGQAAQALESELKGRDGEVASVQEKPFTQKPAAPFITSTLQQEASRKLRFTAQRAMRVAQRLYENGYITYMRTDSTTLSQEALSAARSQIEELYGKEYVPSEPRTYSKKVKGAQEAHEAIRPAGKTFRMPDELKSELDDEAFKLYELIWKRTVACQMKDAKGERTSVRIHVDVDKALSDKAGVDIEGKALFTVSGKVITFPGFLRAYVEGSDDPDAELEDKEKILPPVKKGDILKIDGLEAKKSTTQPPARFTEASLVKELEARGIGRPSTYASIIQTIQDRGYVWKKSGALVPTLTAFAVVRLLEQHFEDLVDYAFTAKMESDLDEISNGEKESKPWLEKFYWGAKGKGHKTDKTGPLMEVGLHNMIGTGVEDIDARGICSMPIGENDNGELIEARVGRYGPYLQVGDTDTRANLPEDLPPDELDVKEAQRLLHQAAVANRQLGVHPETGQPVYLKSGRYGPYVQLGDPELTPKGNIKKGSKPRMSSLFPEMDIETLTLDEAVFLLSFPKNLGDHPEHGVPILAQDGQFGPYISMQLTEEKRDSRSLEGGHEQLKNITLDEAVKLFAEPRKRGRRQAAGPMAELGTSPVTGKEITVRNGRFGPYVTDGEVNATIPTVRDPMKITFDDALELIATRESKMRDQGKDPRPKKKDASAKAAPTKKAAKKVTKKAGAKKAAKKKAAPKKKASKKKASKKKAAT